MILAAIEKAPQLPISEHQLALANLVGALLLVVGLAVFARLFRRVAEDGGRVRTDHFALMDLFIAISLVAGLSLLAALAFLTPAHGGDAAPKHEVTAELILSGSLFLFIPAVGICAFLVSRGCRSRMRLASGECRW